MGKILHIYGLARVVGVGVEQTVVARERAHHVVAGAEARRGEGVGGARRDVEPRREDVLR